MLRSNDDRRRSRRGSLATPGLIFGLVLAVAFTAATVSAQPAAPALKDVYGTKSSPGSSALRPARTLAVPNFDREWS